jgi:cell division protein FtsI/penicillin-binding protein 2
MKKSAVIKHCGNKRHVSKVFAQKELQPQLFKNTAYKVAGKTGTALVANGNRGYADKIYQSSFAGYFPADNPEVYLCGGDHQ